MIFLVFRVWFMFNLCHRCAIFNYEVTVNWQCGSTLVIHEQYSIYEMTFCELRVWLIFYLFGVTFCEFRSKCYSCSTFFIAPLYRATFCEISVIYALLLSLMSNIQDMRWVFASSGCKYFTFVSDVQYSMYGETVSSECNLFYWYFCHWWAIFYVWGDCEFRMWLVLLLSLMCNILCMGWLWVQNVTCSTFVTDVQ